MRKNFYRKFGFGLFNMALFALFVWLQLSQNAVMQGVENLYLQREATAKIFFGDDFDKQPLFFENA